MSALRWATFLLLLLVGIPLVQACPVCFSAPESPETKGMTLAILFLLGTIGLVICGVGSFFIYLISQEKHPSAGHQELAHLAAEQPPLPQ